MDPAGQDMNNRKLPHLSHRLQAIVDLLGDGTHYEVVADVGCDHGWVSITLIQKGIADKVIASDVRSGPLERAKEHVAQYEAGGMDHKAALKQVALDRGIPKREVYDAVHKY